MGGHARIKDSEREHPTWVSSCGVKVSIVGKATRREKPYLRLEDAEGDYLGCIDIVEMVELRDALTAALRGIVIEDGVIVGAP